MFKKKALVLALLASFVSVQFRPRPAQAIVGAITANPALVMWGAAVTSTAGVSAVWTMAGWCTAFCNHPWGYRGGNDDKESLFWILTIGAAGLLTGLVLLDEGDQTIPAFAPLNPAAPGTLAALGSGADLEAYNHEVDELNAIRESVQAQANELVARGAKFDIQQSASLWQAHRHELSPQTFQVAGRILEQAQRALSPSATRR